MCTRLWLQMHVCVCVSVCSWLQMHVCACVFVCEVVNADGTARSQRKLLPKRKFGEQLGKPCEDTKLGELHGYLKT